MNRRWLRGIWPKIILGLVFSGLNLSVSGAETGMKTDQNEVLVIGTGALVAGNVAAARKMAISRALVKGVEGYLSRRLGSKGMINYFPRILHDLMPEAREVIENFHILAEEQVEDRYKILVRVRINDNVMDEKLRDIGFVLAEGPPIKVLFLVSQIEPTAEKSSFWWRDPEMETPLTPTELTLYRIFQERGFQPINRSLSPLEGNYTPEMQVLELSDEDAIRWGRLFSADVVIHGSCKIIGGAEVYVSLKALHVANGMMIYENSQRERMEEDLAGMEQIIRTVEKAVDHVAARLSPEIIRAIEEPEARIVHLEITLKGLKGFKQFRELKGYLERQIAGIRSVKQSRIKGSDLSLSIEFLGDQERFLARLSRGGRLPIEADVTRTEEGKIFVIAR